MLAYSIDPTFTPVSVCDLEFERCQTGEGMKMTLQEVGQKKRRSCIFFLKLLELFALMASY